MVGRPPPRPSPTNCVGEGGATHLAGGVRARRAENTARMHGRRGNASRTLSGGGSAQLATVVSLPTAHAARPGAQRRDTPKLVVAVTVVRTSSRPTLHRKPGHAPRRRRR